MLCVLCLDLSLPLSPSLFLFLSVSSRDLWGHIAVHRVFFLTECGSVEGFSRVRCLVHGALTFEVWVNKLCGAGFDKVTVPTKSHEPPGKPKHQNS